MKQKILEALKTKFVGVKEEILDRIATKGAKTVTKEEDVATFVEGVTMQSVLDFYGDFRATDATKTAVTNYEKKYKLKDGKPNNEPEPKPNGEEMPSWATAIIDRLDKLDGEKTAKSRRAKLEALLEGGSDKTKARYTKNFDRYNFKDDEDFEAWLEEQKADIEDDIKADKAAAGATTPPGSNTGGVKIVDEGVTKRTEARAKETVTSAIQG